MTNFKALSQAVPQHDYRPALQGALTWLGKRYLLAEPLNRRSDHKEQPRQPRSAQPSSLNSASMA